MLGLSKFIMYMLMVAVIGVGLYWLIQITTACSFHTPSGSMSPTLLPDGEWVGEQVENGCADF